MEGLFRYPLDFYSNLIEDTARNRTSSAVLVIVFFVVMFVASKEGVLAAILTLVLLPYLFAFLTVCIVLLVAVASGPEDM